MNDSFLVESMANALAEDKHRSGYKAKVYKELADEHKNEEISRSIKNRASALKQAINAPKVALSDTEQVKTRVFMYFDACAMSSTFPSVMGMAGAMGFSRQNLYRWLLSHPNHPTTEFINLVRDGFADILTNASLHNDANVVQCIFQLKNWYDHSDRVEIAPIAPNQFEDEEIDVEKIRQRYMLEDDTDTDREDS